MKLVFILTTLILLSGCGLQSPDYADIRKRCDERNGNYFTAVIPTSLGVRLIAGCIEK